MRGRKVKRVLVVVLFWSGPMLLVVPGITRADGWHSWALIAGGFAVAVGAALLAVRWPEIWRDM